MILLSNSIPKTGSTLIANYQEDILSKLDLKSGQKKLKSKYKGRYIESPKGTILIDLLGIDLSAGSVLVKCHWNQNKFLNAFCFMPNVKMTLSYRDPRDIILSLIDHGNRTRAKNDISGAFADCFNILQLIPRVLDYMERLKYWETKNYVHLIKYENLMSDPLNVLKEMIAFLNWNLKDEVLTGLIDNRENNKQKSHNFNKGITERWRNEMSQIEKEECLKVFRPFLERFKYDLE